MLVKHIAKIPDNLFFEAKNEILKINWNNIPFVKGFIKPLTDLENSKYYILRTYDFKKEKIDVLECLDTDNFDNNFTGVRNLSTWTLDKIGGTTIGRLLIVNLTKHGRVNLHIDDFPEKYFPYYQRYHVPIETTKNVVFSDGTTNNQCHEYMLEQQLYRFNNRHPHQVTNNSDSDRIHIIIDILLPEGNNVF